MGNRSVYLDDDEEEFVENNISNFSTFIRKVVRSEMVRKDIGQKFEKKKSFFINWIYISFLVIGAFSISLTFVINTTRMEGSLMVFSLESLVLFFVGVLLIAYSIGNITFNIEKRRTA